MAKELSKTRFQQTGRNWNWVQPTDKNGNRQNTFCFCLSKKLMAAIARCLLTRPNLTVPEFGQSNFSLTDFGTIFQNFRKPHGGFVASLWTRQKWQLEEERWRGSSFVLVYQFRSIEFCPLKKLIFDNLGRVKTVKFALTLVNHGIGLHRSSLLCRVDIISNYDSSISLCSGQTCKWFTTGCSELYGMYSWKRTFVLWGIMQSMQEKYCQCSSHVYLQRGTPLWWNMC